MRKEITFDEAKKLEDGTIVWVDDKYGGKNIECTKIKSKLKESGNFCYDLEKYGIYLNRGVRLYIENEFEKILIGKELFSVDKKTIEKIREMIKPKVIKFKKEHVAILYNLYTQGFRYIAQDENRDVWAFTMKPSFDRIEKSWYTDNLEGDEEEIEFDLDLQYNCYFIEEVIKNYFKENH